MYEAHHLIRNEVASFKEALAAWERGELPFSKVQTALERVFTLLHDHFGEEELVYFPAAERNWSEAEKAEVWERCKPSFGTKAKRKTLKTNKEVSSDEVVGSVDARTSRH